MCEQFSFVIFILCWLFAYCPNTAKMFCSGFHMGAINVIVLFFWELTSILDGAEALTERVRNNKHSLSPPPHKKERKKKRKRKFRTQERIEIKPYKIYVYGNRSVEHYFAFRIMLTCWNPTVSRATVHFFGTFWSFELFSFPK